MTTKATSLVLLLCLVAPCWASRAAKPLRRPPPATAPATSLPDAGAPPAAPARAAPAAPARNATANATTDSGVQAAGCGFLGLGTCSTVDVTLLCRCIGGCRWQVRYVLGQDLDSTRYCSNGAYNYGTTCATYWAPKFKETRFFRVKNGAKFYVNSRWFSPGAYTSSWTVRWDYC